MKKQHYMTREERIRLEAYLRAGKSVAWISRELDFCERTIYYEKKRGTYLHRIEQSGKCREYPRYSADKGTDIHWKAMRGRGRKRKGTVEPEYLNYLEHKILKEKYSPAAALASAREERFEISICTTTLYSYIDRGVFQRLGNIHLQEKVNRKRQKGGERKRVAHPALPSIEQRPQHINERSEDGHWEMDLVMGRKQTSACLLTLTERRSRRELIFKLPNKKAASVRAVFDQLEQEMGQQVFRKIFRSITTDNGSEFLQYQQLINSIYGGTRFQLYYCHPFSAWEKGSNERQNRMIRRWFPKGTDFNRVTPEKIAWVQNWMNHYPRKILGWKTPLEAA